LKLQNKGYLYVGHNTNHLQEKNQILTLSNQAEVFKKLNQKQKILSLGSHDTNFFFKVKVCSYPPLATYFSKEKKKEKE